MAASEWIDENGLTWLAHAPKIRLLPRNDSRKAYPLSWEEQDRLFAKLPEHLRNMALFKVNTGCREQEVCRLQWDWEVEIPELNTSVFLIPSYSIEDGRKQRNVKNGEDRLVVLNTEAKQVIESVRGMHQKYVFVYERTGELKPVRAMNNSAWKRVRIHRDVKLPQVRVHDLKYTFGRRLRAAGVGFEDRQDLLGHKSNRITTHYSSAEIQHLIDAANKVCRRSRSTPTLTVLRTVMSKTPTISPPSGNVQLNIVR